MEQAGALLHGQLQQVREAARPAAGTGSRGIPHPAGSDRAAGSLHQPVSLPGHEGQAGAEPNQGTRAHGPYRDSAGGEGHPLQVPAAGAVGTGGCGADGCRQELRRDPRVRPDRAADRERRPDRAGGREWGGEIDVDPDPRGARAPDGGRATHGISGRDRLFRPGPVQGAGPGGDLVRGSPQPRADDGRYRTAESAGLLPLQRR